MIASWVAFGGQFEVPPASGTMAGERDMADDTSSCRAELLMILSNYES